MLLKTLNRAGNIVLKDYTDKECSDIFLERNSYVLKCVHYYGETYGRFDDDAEHREESYKEIIPERILVKNGKFYGVLIQAYYNWYNGGSMHGNNYRDIILTKEKAGKSYARDGYSKAFEDHEYWNYTDYYLVERPEGVY